MNDREHLPPVNHPSRSEQARKAALSVGSTMNAHPETAPQGDGPPMSLMLAPTYHSRTHSSTGRVADRARDLLAHITATPETLPAFASVEGPLIGEQAPAEVAAVARAAGCPDLFVVHVPDQSAGERVIAAISWLSIPGRTLVLSPDPATADRIVERLACVDPVRDHHVQVIRTLTEEENPIRPSQIVSKLTSAAILAQYEQQLRQEANAAVATADTRLAALERLGELTDLVARLDAEVAELRESCDSLSTTVAAEVAADQSTLSLKIARTVTERCKIRDEVVAGLDAQIQALTVTRESVAQQLATLRQQHASALAEASKKPGLFGRLLGIGKPNFEPAELEHLIQTAENDLLTIDGRATELHAERARVQGDASEAIIRDELTRDEVAARFSQIEQRIAAIRENRNQTQAEIDSLSTNDANTSNIAEARVAANHHLCEARERVAEVDQCMCHNARQSLAAASIVVGTPGSLHTDPVFDRDPSGNFVPFDLLILDRAEELTESDFVRLALLGRRWVLIGEVLPTEEPHHHWNGNGGVPHAHRNGRQSEPSFAARVARELDREPWVLDANWLVCRLAHATAEQYREMTREPLLDRPEVELRFITDEAGEPVLAEVAFPPETSFASAKALLFAEMGDVRLRPCGSEHWHETDNTLTVCWPLAETGSSVEWIDLHTGVREKVVGDGLAAFTATVVFDPAIWDKERAAAWLAEHLPTHSASRFAAIPRMAHTGW